jgi:hypothetical protein
MAVFEKIKPPSRFFLRLMGAIDHIDGFDDGEEREIRNYN